MSAKQKDNKQSIPQLFSQYCAELGNGLLEREEAVPIILLAALVGQNTFLLGEPGIAKSLLARRLQYLFRDGDSENSESVSYFEYLMNQFSEPDQLFGPLDLKELKEGTYSIKTEGYLPKAHIVFLDEIWKANPAIQNTLLSILNEKKFHNGSKTEDVPLKAFICASNELPAQTKEENQSLQALWDRITVRLELLPLQETEHFRQLLAASSTQPQCEISRPLSLQQLKQWRADIAEIPLGAVAESAILSMRQKLRDLNTGQEQPIFVSDRRWQQIALLVRGAAFANGHTEPDIIDASVMLHSIWESPQYHEQLREFWNEILKDNAYTIEEEMGNLEQSITDYYKQVKGHYAEEEHELVCGKDGFIPFETAIKYDNYHAFVAIHRNSWKQLQKNPKEFVSENHYKQNWWVPKMLLQDSTVWENDRNTQCTIDPNKTNWSKTVLTNVYNGSWTGPMKLKTRKIKDDGFDTQKFLESNKTGSAHTIIENNKVFESLKELHSEINVSIELYKESIENFQNRVTETYEKNYFLLLENVLFLRELAEKDLSSLAVLLLKIGRIRSVYQKAAEDTSRSVEKMYQVIQQNMHQENKP
ncbi:AAA family ATPase [Candidatus Haliotispira prima]|uniref:AAA family ATPase n=1 Tax=Candidatus Haliotispira prima TaxID=3034016 RepID=A0ABY8MJY4_9SPIO|nr:AAA family ATPase [Candidatus Haliotispira prima]